MPIFLDEKSRRDALKYAAAHPADGEPTGLLENFVADWNYSLRVSQSIAESRNRYEVIEAELDAFQNATGEKLPNPEAQGHPMLRKEAYDRVSKRFADEDMEFPTLDVIHQRAVSIGQVAQAKQEDVRSRATGMGAVGSFAGGMAGAVADPLNLATLSVGAGAASGILRTALIEAGIGAGTEAIIQASNFQYRQRVDPNFTLGDAATETAVAALGGGIFGGGVKALARGISALRSRGIHLDREVQDAANVTEAEAFTQAQNPYQDVGPAGESAHRETLKAVAETMRSDAPYQPPASAQQLDGLRRGRVYAPGRDPVEVGYDVVEMADLVTSHGDDMTVNPEFPQHLKPRDRTRPISASQVIDIASNLEPERLGPSTSAVEGAPIIGPDGIVESGNARVMAVRRAYRLYPDRGDEYRAYLSGLGYDVADMREPVLVARRLTDLSDADRVAFTDAANRSTALRMSATEQALADARLMSADVLDALEDVSIETAKNRDFARAFIAKLPESERGAMIDADGRLSADGVRRIRAALLAKAYEEPVLLSRVLEDTDNNIKGIGEALTDTAGPWSVMRDMAYRGGIPPEMDVTRDLMDAVRMVMDARDSGTKIKDLVLQQGLFGDLRPVGRFLLGHMFKLEMTRAVGRDKLAGGLRAYADEAAKNTTDARLFGEALRPEDVLIDAARRAGREDLVPFLEERMTPEAAEQALDDPKVTDAAAADFDRAVAARETGDEAAPEAVWLNDVDDLGNPVTVQRTLRVISDELDAEEDLAREIAACAIGSTVSPALPVAI